MIFLLMVYFKYQYILFENDIYGATQSRGIFIINNRMHKAVIFLMTLICYPINDTELSCYVYHLTYYAS